MSLEALRAYNAEKSRRYRLRHIDKAREHTRRWRASRDPVQLLAHAREVKAAWMSKPENRMRHVLGQAKRRADRAGIPFALSIGDLLPLPTRCPVLGIQLNYGGTRARGFIDDSPSLDRHDPALGYVPGNVRVMSWRANRIKSDATVAELRAVVTYMETSACN